MRIRNLPAPFVSSFDMLGRDLSCVRVSLAQSLFFILDRKQGTKWQ